VKYDLRSRLKIADIFTITAFAETKAAFLRNCGWFAEQTGISAFRLFFLPEDIEKYYPTDRFTVQPAFFTFTRFLRRTVSGVASVREIKTSSRLAPAVSQPIIGQLFLERSEKSGFLMSMPFSLSTT